MKKTSFAAVGIVVTLLCLGHALVLSAAGAQSSPPASGAGSALLVPQAVLVQPADLNRLLQAPSAKPLVLQVGSHVLYAEAHIRGSQYAGPGGEADGLQLLRSKVDPLPRTQSIVIYCGCCPWNRCPNIGPAFRQLQQMGFKSVKVLYIADNFGANWVAKGYPVDAGR
ncbi:MAG TPA: rhodanese-like domain-containing protein [Acidobacteriaceae bacterium]|nr:rhodanese-like domain-containing protein [Acidobacteriaceae bacterium]